jgi:redox-sensitive bicupin YhaK (pirin superfamily)
MESELRETLAVVPSHATSDGAGVRLKRSIGGPEVDYLDPFLLLDEFGSEDGADYIAGFPDHPHRGIETVTYMLDGRMRHGDNKGNSGVLTSGSVQWMTAGRGIVHSEMPEQEEGLMRGFQLWVNLPAKDKMCEPYYQNFAPDEVPEVRAEDGIKVRVVAGAYQGTQGAVQGIAADPTYLDVTLPAGAAFEHAIARGHTAFAYVFEGVAEVGGVRVESGQLAVLGEGDRVAASAPAEASARFILVAGKPLGEPIARWGPFVMNTREEILQAVDDYRAGRF